MKKIITFILLICSIFVNGQNKEKKSESTFIFKPTGTVFPEEFMNFKRDQIIFLENNKRNVGVFYKNTDSTKVNVFLYKSKESFEGKLRKEYLNSINTNALTGNPILNQKIVQIKDEKFTINGISGLLTNDSEKQLVSVYELGSWFFKIRIEANNLNEDELFGLEKEFIDKLSPNNILQKNYLETKATVLVSDELSKDEPMLVAVMGSFFEKLDWINTNVPIEERKTGFPDLYLDMHINSLMKFQKFSNSKMNLDVNTKYVSEINKIIDSGFLAEFIMDEYKNLLKYSDERNFDYEGYKDWRQKNKINVNLNNLQYTLKYLPK